jgi:hypothetical protein
MRLPSGLWVQFKNAFGLDLISYVCALDETQTQEVQAGRFDQLTHGQQSALDALVEALEPIRQEAAVHGLPLFHWGRAHSVGHVAQDTDLLGFGLGMNALSWHRHRKRRGVPAAA